jgi:hypothetical protein
VFKKVCLKYTILIIRNKISYSAFLQNKTIIELFISNIKQTFDFLKPANSDDKENEAFTKIIGDIMNDKQGIFKKVVKFYSEKNSFNMPKKLL